MQVFSVQHAALSATSAASACVTMQLAAADASPVVMSVLNVITGPATLETTKSEPFGLAAHGAARVTSQLWLPESSPAVKSVAKPITSPSTHATTRSVSFGAALQLFPTRRRVCPAAIVASAAARVTLFAPASMDDTAAPEEIAGDDVPDRSRSWNLLPDLIAASAVSTVTVLSPSLIEAIDLSGTIATLQTVPTHCRSATPRSVEYR